MIHGELILYVALIALVDPSDNIGTYSYPILGYSIKPYDDFILLCKNQQ
jgi:hypothetical protein